MKAGMLQCDRLVTVSPNYALEILSDIARGVELHTIARLKTVCGIANGMDVQEWNPLTDKYIAVNYDETTVRTSLSLEFSLVYILFASINEVVNHRCLMPSLS